jgi:hypothetical protein
MMHAVDEHDDIRALLRAVDPGETPAFDADVLMARGGRSRRVRRLDRWLAVAASVAILVGVGVGVAHLAGSPTPPLQSPSPSHTPSVAPSPAPTDASQYLAAAQSAIRTAHSVRFVAQVGGGGVLDVVVDPHYARGTLTAKGLTSRYVADASHVYIEPAALAAIGMLSADDVAKAHGRWIAMIGVAPLNEARTSYWVAASLDHLAWPRPTLGTAPNDMVFHFTLTLTRTIAGTPWYLTVDRAAPYRPVTLRIGSVRTSSAAFSEWDAPVVPPTFPAADDIYDPLNQTP